MNETLEKSIELMKKISVGCKVRWNKVWYTVDAIVPCGWQFEKDDPADDSCGYCIGRLKLKDSDDNYIMDYKDDDEEWGCHLYGNNFDFDNVIGIELITEDEFSM
jgi:hypothetical protein